MLYDLYVVFALNLLNVVNIKLNLILKINIFGNERCVVFSIHKLVFSFFKFVERSNELNQSQKKKIKI